MRSPGITSRSCAACHRDFSTPALKKPAFATCSACHRDAHNGTATIAGRQVDCATVTPSRQGTPRPTPSRLWPHEVPARGSTPGWSAPPAT
jgi:hypothetical protein